MPSHAPEAGPPAPVIGEPYLLALAIPLVRDEAGQFYADPSWAKDLLLHTEYIARLTLVCPFVPGERPAGWHAVAAPGLRVAAYRSSARGIGQYLAVARLIARLAREVPRATLVHCGIAGYPIPTAWAAVPLARLFGRAVVIPVESAFWRLPHGETRGRRKAAFWEAVNRWCLARADYAAYSQDAYRRSLPSPRADGGVLFQASWIDDAVVLTNSAVSARHAAAEPGSTRFLFASRMIAEKGTGVVADALRLLAAQDADVAVDIIGEGPELAGLSVAADGEWGRRHVRILEPITYGPAFFALLRGYDAVLVPSLSDEQPRIVYDAYSQGVPVIAADTPGTRACVRDGETGVLVAPGDPAALATVLMAADRGVLRRYGLAGRDLAQAHTHRGMHRERAEGLRAMLDRRI